MMTHGFSDPALDLVGETLLLVNVDADPLPEDQFHGCRVAQLNDRLEDHVDSLVVRGHSVQMDGVMDGRIPRCQHRYLREEKQVEDSKMIRKTFWGKKSQGFSKYWKTFGDKIPFFGGLESDGVKLRRSTTQESSNHCNHCNRCNHCNHCNHCNRCNHCNHCNHCSSSQQCCSLITIICTFTILFVRK